MGPPCLGLQETLTAVVHCQLPSGLATIEDILNLLIYLLSLRLNDGPRATGITQAHATSSMVVTLIVLNVNDQRDVHEARVHSHGKQGFSSKKSRKWREKYAIF